MLYRRKLTLAEAITFNELVEHGKEQEVPLIDNMPWSFSYKGNRITHLTNTCYLIPSSDGLVKFTPNDLLATDIYGNATVYTIEEFNEIYEIVEG